MTPLAATESERLKVDRKSFEEWAIGPDGPWTTRAVTQRVGDGYGVPDLQTQWECWQAARASQKSAAQATAEPVDPANKHCRWPMCESEAVQQQIAEEVAESIFGIAAPDRAPSTDSAAGKAEPVGWREFITNIATPRSEPLNSVSGYRDMASRKEKMGELRLAAQRLLAAHACSPSTDSTGGRHDE